MFTGVSKGELVQKWWVTVTWKDSGANQRQQAQPAPTTGWWLEQDIDIAEESKRYFFPIKQYFPTGGKRWPAREIPVSREEPARGGDGAHRSLRKACSCKLQVTQGWHPGPHPPPPHCASTFRWVRSWRGTSWSGWWPAAPPSSSSGSSGRWSAERSQSGRVRSLRWGKRFCYMF